jgi:hypothetical protein
LQQNCSPLWGIQPQDAGEMIYHLQSFCCSESWISTNAHEPILYSRMHKTDTAISSTTPSLIMLTEHTQKLMMLISFSTAFIVSIFAGTFPLNSRTSWCTVLFYSIKVS